MKNKNDFWDIVFDDLFQKASKKHSHLLTKYGVTTDEYLDLVEEEIKRLSRIDKIDKIINNVK